jgi:hypothetical protein
MLSHPLLSDQLIMILYLVKDFVGEVVKKLPTPRRLEVSAIKTISSQVFTDSITIVIDVMIGGWELLSSSGPTFSMCSYWI